MSSPVHSYSSILSDHHFSSTTPVKQESIPTQTPTKIRGTRSVQAATTVAQRTLSDSSLNLQVSDKWAFSFSSSSSSSDDVSVMPLPPNPVLPMKPLSQPKAKTVEQIFKRNFARLETFSDWQDFWQESFALCNSKEGGADKTRGWAAQARKKSVWENWCKFAMQPNTIKSTSPEQLMRVWKQALPLAQHFPTPTILDLFQRPAMGKMLAQAIPFPEEQALFYKDLLKTAIDSLMKRTKQDNKSPIIPDLLKLINTHLAYCKTAEVVRDNAISDHEYELIKLFQNKVPTNGLEPVCEILINFLKNDSHQDTVSSFFSQILDPSISRSNDAKMLILKVVAAFRECAPADTDWLTYASSLSKWNGPKAVDEALFYTMKCGKAYREANNELKILLPMLLQNCSQEALEKYKIWLQQLWPTPIKTPLQACEEFLVKIWKIITKRELQAKDVYEPVSLLNERYDSYFQHETSSIEWFTEQLKPLFATWLTDANNNLSQIKGPETADTILLSSMKHCQAYRSADDGLKALLPTLLKNCSQEALEKYKIWLQKLWPNPIKTPLQAKEKFLVKIWELITERELQAKDVDAIALLTARYNNYLQYKKTSTEWVAEKTNHLLVSHFEGTFEGNIVENSASLKATFELLTTLETKHQKLFTFTCEKVNLNIFNNLIVFAENTPSINLLPLPPPNASLPSRALTFNHATRCFTMAADIVANLLPHLSEKERNTALSKLTSIALKLNLTSNSKQMLLALTMRVLFTDAFQKFPPETRIKQAERAFNNLDFWKLFYLAFGNAKSPQIQCIPHFCELLTPFESNESILKLKIQAIEEVVSELIKKDSLPSLEMAICILLNKQNEEFKQQIPLFLTLTQNLVKACARFPCNAINTTHPLFNLWESMLRDAHEKISLPLREWLNEDHSKVRSTYINDPENRSVINDITENIFEFIRSSSIATFRNSGDPLLLVDLMTKTTRFLHYLSFLDVYKDHLDGYLKKLIALQEINLQFLAPKLNREKPLCERVLFLSDYLKTFNSMILNNGTETQEGVENTLSYLREIIPYILDIYINHVKFIEKYFDSHPIFSENKEVLKLEMELIKSLLSYIHHSQDFETIPEAIQKFKKAILPLCSKSTILQAMALFTSAISKENVLSMLTTLDFLFFLINENSRKEPTLKLFFQELLTPLLDSGSQKHLREVGSKSFDLLLKYANEPIPGHGSKEETQAIRNFVQKVLNFLFTLTLSDFVSEYEDLIVEVSSLRREIAALSDAQKLVGNKNLAEKNNILVKKNTKLDDKRTTLASKKNYLFFLLNNLIFYTHYFQTHNIYELDDTGYLDNILYLQKVLQKLCETEDSENIESPRSVFTSGAFDAYEFLLPETLIINSDSDSQRTQEYRKKKEEIYQSHLKWIKHMCTKHNVIFDEKGPCLSPKVLQMFLK